LLAFLLLVLAGKKREHRRIELPCNSLSLL